jgi:hypothetical protein
VALRNTGTQDTTLTLTLVNGAGVETARVERTLAAGGQLSRFVDELFGNLQAADFVGTMTIRSTQPVSIVALAFDRDGVVTIPVTPVE